MKQRMAMPWLSAAFAAKRNAHLHRIAGPVLSQIAADAVTYADGSRAKNATITLYPQSTRTATDSAATTWPASYVTTWKTWSVFPQHFGMLSFQSEFLHAYHNRGETLTRKIQSNKCTVKGAWISILKKKLKSSRNKTHQSQQRIPSSFHVDYRLQLFHLRAFYLLNSIGCPFFKQWFYMSDRYILYT